MPKKSFCEFFLEFLGVFVYHGTKAEELDFFFKISGLRIPTLIFKNLNNIVKMRKLNSKSKNVTKQIKLIIKLI
jgi:hypothetical protein